MGLTTILERRILHRLLARHHAKPIRLHTSACHRQADQDKSSFVSIGDVSKPIKPSLHPEYVPSKYLPKDEDVPAETLQHLKWIMQKDLLGQDVFLIGRPGPLRRQVAMQYLQLTQREIGHFSHYMFSFFSEPLGDILKFICIDSLPTTSVHASFQNG